MKNIFIFLFLIGLSACVTMQEKVLSQKEKDVMFIVTKPKRNEWLHEICEMKGIIEEVNENEARIWAVANDANLVEVLIVATTKEFSFHERVTFDGVGFFCKSFVGMPR